MRKTYLVEMCKKLGRKGEQMMTAVLIFTGVTVRDRERKKGREQLRQREQKLWTVERWPVKAEGGRR